MDTTTKIYQLKSLIAKLAKNQIIIKQHRKTVKFTGERKTIELPLFLYPDKKTELVKIELTAVNADQLTNSSSWMKINGKNCVLASYPEWNCKGTFMSTGDLLNTLYMVYGILRNRRKTKKVQYFEDRKDIFEKGWSTFKPIFDYYDDELQK